MRPLDGITVVALEQVIAGPFATRQLAELGARVIKIERPEGGDPARAYDRTVKGESSHFAWVNRSKESLTLDVKHPEAKAILARLIEKAAAAGIPPDALYIDPLVYPLATNHLSAEATFKAIREIMRLFPGIHTICGLTNVSYGLPARRLVNRTFLTGAVLSGLDSAILDPTDKELFAALTAALLTAGKDEYCMNYIRAFREKRFE